jgi:hypothetical protein
MPFNSIQIARLAKTARTSSGVTGFDESTDSWSDYQRNNINQRQTCNVQEVNIKTKVNLDIKK